MLYAIIGIDAPDARERRLAAREAHLARAGALRDQGAMVLAGPMLAQDIPDPLAAGFAGSLIVAEFESLDAARAWIDADPYVLQGVFERVEVRPFKQVLP